MNPYDGSGGSGEVKIVMEMPMAHPLESAITDTIKREKDLQRKLGELEVELKSALDRESILKGRIETLDQNLLDSKSKADYYMIITVEMAKQLNNVGIFVDDALRLAREAIAGNSKGKDVTEEAQKAIEKVLEIGNAVQHEGKR